MIAKLTGTVDSVGDESAVIDVNGVGYLVHCSTRTLGRLPPQGGVASLLVETQVREDRIQLFGFADAAERDWLRMLSTVQGVGARTGLAILSTLSPDELVAAIAHGDKGPLTRAAGVGPKLAQRIVSELKDRVQAPVAATLPANVAGDGGLYSTAADYAQFARMLLNGGRAGSTRLLSERTVRSMFQNHTGRVVVPLQRSTNQSLSKDFPFGAGEDNWGLGFELAQPKARKANTRASGSGTWAGIFNTHFWIDPKNEVGVIVMMQTLPFYDDAAMQVLGGVEEIVYRNLK